MPEKNPNNWNKEKPPLWVTNDIDSDSVVLDSVTFYLKYSTSPRMLRAFIAARYHRWIIE